MKARLDRDVLRKALHTVTPAIGKSSLSVLNGVRIDTVDGDGLRLCCSDLQLTITADVDAKVLAEGTVVVPARLLSNIVDRLDGGAVELTVDDGTLLVTCGETSGDLHSLSADEWPRLPVAKGAVVDLTAEQVGLLRRVLPFASTDDSPQRAVLNGVLLKGDRAVTTDSYRLAAATLAGCDFTEAIIPAGVLTKALKDATTAGVEVGTHFVSIHHDATTWTSVLIEGDYPPWERLIPAEQPHEISMATEDLLSAIAKTSVLNSHLDKGSPSAIKIAHTDDLATFTGQVPDVGRMTDVIPCEGTIDFEVAFRPDFLAAVAMAADVDRLTLQLTDSLKPATARVDDLLLLIMPVRVSW